MRNVRRHLAGAMMALLALGGAPAMTGCDNFDEFLDDLGDNIEEATDDLDGNDDLGDDIDDFFDDLFDN